MKILRKLIGSKMQFRYVAEYVELLPNRKINVYERDIEVARTQARRTTGFAFEYYDDRHNKWFVISDIQYFKILNNHKAKKTIIKRNNKEVQQRTLHDVFNLSDHFVQRIKERYINHDDAIVNLLGYMIENGYYIEPKNHTIRKSLKGPGKRDRFYFYEHDLRMLWVCVLNTKTAKLELITIYDPEESEWFNKWIKKKDRLKSQVTVKEFIKTMR